MFGIGETELIIILLFGFMVFGPDKLPGMGRTIGRALRQFREAQQGFTQVVQTEVLDPAAEAMNAAPTRRTRNRAAELEADSDLEGAEDGETPVRKETFAERRARLEAERKAAQEAEAQASALPAGPASDETEAADGEDADAPDVAPAPESETPAPSAETAAQAAPVSIPEKDSVASLYDISAKTTKSARKQASEEKAAAAAARKAEAEAKAAEKASAEPAEPDTAPEPAEPDTAPEAAEPDTAPEPAEPDTAPEPAEPDTAPEPDTFAVTGKEDGAPTA